ncbi:MAG: rhomboid family intramembrane serine protease [Defluviitaleaceae bacterium]|nr:rhomboid family intramembrane serine protease [Defluviitaleaceae bacterium]
MNYAEFAENFTNIMSAAGYERINMPIAESINLPQNRGLCLWGKVSGSVAYYYAIYEIDMQNTVGYTMQKVIVDQYVATITSRYGMRHSVVFNMIVGDLSGDIREIEKLIDNQDDFAMMTKYDVYYGVDTANLRIMRNTSQPHNIDGALKKIERALKGVVQQIANDHTIPISKRPYLCYTIITINLLMFLLMEANGGSQNTITLIRYGAVSNYYVFTMGEYHRLLTSSFLHIGFLHLLMNTGFLIIFATRLEVYIGHIKFLLIYLASGILGSLASILLNPLYTSAGASGALFGALGALVAVAGLRKQHVQGLNIRMLMMLVVINVLFGLAINQWNLMNIGNAAHLGGLVTGFVLGYILTWRIKA